MRHRCFTVIICLLLFLCTPITSHAASVVIGSIDNGEPSHESSEESGGGGEEGSGEGSGGGGEGSGEYVPMVPKQLLITPKVTALHSLNALLVNGTGYGDNDLGVYFIPSLADFPVPLKDTVACVIGYDNIEHRFAVVYDGYFDTEVTYVQAEVDAEDVGNIARLQTSKKVYSSVDNTRTLNLIGYDLLLSREEVHITASDSELTAEYAPSLVGTGPLTAETVIMDLYKSIGEYEWDIKYVFVKDDDLLLETSPIQSEMGVAISDRIEKGIDTSEGATYVWATRTNPELYWNRCRKDAIFDGGAHSVTNTLTASFVGSQVSVSFGKSQGDTVTFGEFCAMARAIMDLYGEPVMTVAEQQVMIQNYGINLPSCQDKELYDSVVYLAAKGIIDPSEVSYNKMVTFADIEPILVRIADTDSRLTFKEANYNTSSELYQKGFVSANTSMVPGALMSVDTVNSNVTTTYNDFFVQCDDDVTNFILSPQDTPDDTFDDVLAADSLTCNGIMSSSVVDGMSEGEFDYMFQNMGVEGNFYHFKINQEVSEVTIAYERDVSRSEMVLNHESYTLPNANGGIYLVNNGEFTWYSFDEAAGKTYMVGDEIKQLPEYSLTYVDNDRRQSSEVTEFTDFGFMSNWTWVVCSFDDKAHESMSTYTLCGTPLTDLQGMSSGETLVIADGSGMSQPGITVKYICESDSNTGTNTHRYIFQVPYEESYFKSNFSDKSAIASTNNAYYCPNNDETLVSYDYLKTKGLVASCSEESNGTRCIITLAKDKTNVVLDKSNGTILVGNTLYKVSNSDMLFTKSNGVMYINYRACIGWTTNILVLNNSGNIIITQPGDKDREVTVGTRSMQTYFPNAQAQIGTATFKGDMYVNLASMNPLGNYLLVMDTSGTNTDYLFMWKRREYVTPGSNGVQSYGDDSAARALFTDKTGMSIGGSEDFVLLYKALNRRSDFSTNDGRYKYYISSVKASTGVESLKEYGWWYNPDVYSDYSEAITDYLNCGSADKMPIAKISNAFCNLNINFCTLDAVSDPLPAGTMPEAYAKGSTRISNVAGAKMSRVKGASSYETTGATYTVATPVQILPAPVGMFASLYGLPTSTVGKASRNTIWYGSQACEVSNGKLVLKTSRYIVDSDSDKVLSALYMGGGKDAIYSCGTNVIGVNVAEASEGLQVGSITTDPNYLVDWDAFKFYRLVTKLDEWSTIWLIFALNILPRIAMMFFFILMILSLINDIPFVKWFCHNVFDVYKFLTVGRVSVDNVNLKRLFIQSIIALAIFGMVQDGLLFQFMMWCGQLFIELNQR